MASYFSHNASYLLLPYFHKSLKLQVLTKVNLNDISFIRNF